ncbi:MAG: hypothetical protein QW328_08775 [Nitrososphaerota archaeon]
MNEVVLQQERILAVTEKEIQQLKTQYDMFRRLQQVVLEENVDYGFPSGKRTAEQKPSLYKSGAEKLTRLFNLTPEFDLIKQIEEQDFIMYTFKCRLKTVTGQLIGEGYGACNSREKQGWKANPWAFQNNVLKMAKKRAHVDAVLTGLGASNVFTQDLEDSNGDEEKPAQQKPQQQPSQVQQEQKATEKQIKLLHFLMNEIAKLSECDTSEIEEEIKAKHNIQHFNDMTTKQASQAIEELKATLQVLQAQGG